MCPTWSLFFSVHWLELKVKVILVKVKIMIDAVIIDGWLEGRGYPRGNIIYDEKLEAEPKWL